MKKFVVLTLVVLLGSVVFLGSNLKNVALADNAYPQEVVKNQGQFKNGDNYCNFGYGDFKGGLITAISDLTGLTVEEIAAKRAEGKSLVAIASEQGISKEELVESILSEREAWFNDQVNNNNITKEIAAARLSNMKQRISDQLDRTGVGHFKRGMGTKRGMHNGFGNGACLNQY